ncbi:MAG: type IV secretory system conjugative DNA transfer family protein, partial [Patescibacteria group bacterium]
MATPSKVNYFAQTDFRGKQTKFGIKSEDRARHVYTIGKTGMGKSTLLENMAVQDIINGEGMAFIDPHGKTADLLLDYVPEERIKDVIYFAPFDLDNPVSFNVMEDVGKDQRHLVANGLMATFKKIWPDVWSARMEYILGNTILALLEYPDSTLLGVNRMLSDKAYRDKVVNNVSDGSVRAFWLDEFANYNERYMQEAGDAIKNKIGQFTANPLIRNIIGQPKSSIDMRKVMDEKKILIINLSKGQVGEQNASLLGGMIITKIYLAAMSRSNVPERELKELPYFYFFVDEFQSFVNDSFADILAEARKYKLSLTIAHQYIEQMPETVRNAVFGNVGTTICFRVGPFDAEVLETIFFPTFTKEDLVNLGFAQIYLTLMVDGVGSPPFSATTLPPIAQVENSHRETIITSSRQAYSAPRAVVEKQINDWQEDGRDANPAPRPSANRRLGSNGNGSSSKSWPVKAPVPRVEAVKSPEKSQPEALKQFESITPSVSQTPPVKP